MHNFSQNKQAPEVPNTLLTLKNVREQRDQLHLPGIPLPYTQPHWLQFGIRITQSQFHSQKRGCYKNAGVFICLYSQCNDGKADREVTKTSKQCKQVPRKWLNKPGGGGAKPKAGQCQHCCRDSRARCAAALGREDRQTAAALPVTHTQLRLHHRHRFRESHLSACPAKLQHNTGVSAVDLPAYTTKITSHLKAK